MQFHNVLWVMLPGLIIPLIAFFRGPKAMAIAFLALTPLYMYHKSMFFTVHIGSTELQIPTLTKDIFSVFIMLYVLGWLSLKKQPLKFNRDQLRHFVILVVLSMLAVGQSLLFGRGIVTTIMGIRPNFLFPIVGVIFALFFQHDTKAFAASFHWLLWGCAALGVVCMIQETYPNFLMHPTIGVIWKGVVLQDINNIGGRLRGFFTNPNVLSWFMSLGLLVVAWFLNRKEGFFAYPLYLILIPFFVVVLFLTQSRASIIGIFVSFLLWSVMTLRRFFMWILIATALVSAPVAAMHMERYSLDVWASNPRLIIWRALLLKTLSSPQDLVFGNGLGSSGRFGVETGQINLRVFQKELSGMGDYVLDNVYLKILYETGFIGALHIAWILVLYYRCLEIVRAMDQKSLEFYSFPLVLMTYILVISFFGSQLYTYPWSLLFFLCAFFILGKTPCSQPFDLEFCTEDSG